MSGLVVVPKPEHQEALHLLLRLSGETCAGDGSGHGTCGAIACEGDTFGWGDPSTAGDGTGSG